jgi:hypothetical protein
MLEAIKRKTSSTRTGFLPKDITIISFEIIWLLSIEGIALII